MLSRIGSNTSNQTWWHRIQDPRFQHGMHMLSHHYSLNVLKRETRFHLFRQDPFTSSFPLFTFLAHGLNAGELAVWINRIQDHTLNLSLLGIIGAHRLLLPQRVFKYRATLCDLVGLDRESIGHTLKTLRLRNHTLQIGQANAEANIRGRKVVGR